MSQDKLLHANQDKIQTDQGMVTIRVIGLIIIFLLFATCLLATDLHVLEDRVAQNPSDVTSLYNLGVAAFKAGDLEKARASFSTLKPFCSTKKITPERSAEVFYNAGNTEFKLNDYPAALESFEAVLTYDPDNQKAREKRDYIKKLLEQQKQQQQEKQQDKQDQKDPGQDKQKQDKDQNKDQNKDQDKTGDQQGTSDQKDQEKAGEKTGEPPVSESQKQLLELADKLDKQAQEQIIRQQAGMRARVRGQHEW